MITRILTKTYTEPPINKAEILRYAGCNSNDLNINNLINDCIGECAGKLLYKVCYTEVPIEVTENIINLSFTNIQSYSLYKNLKNCSSAIIFGATIGIEIDRLIHKYSASSPSKALIFQAIGAERIESLVNLFNNDIENELTERNLFTVPRFSPGYGDFTISTQKDIFRLLDCPRKIGLSLNESMIMSPSKSVTAIIGVSNSPTVKCKNKCTDCNKKNCSFRSK